MFNSNEVKAFRNGALSRGVIGHYTAMVWAETDAIGCAIVQKRNYSTVYKV